MPEKTVSVKAHSLYTGLVRDKKTPSKNPAQPSYESLYLTFRQGEARSLGIKEGDRITIDIVEIEHSLRQENQN